MGQSCFCSWLTNNNKAINLYRLIFMLCSLTSASKAAIDLSSKCPHTLTTSNLQNYAPPNNQTLLVLVPWKVGFEQFVKFSPDSCMLDGFSVQVFLQALRRMPPHYLQFEFVLTGDGTKTPSYDGMIEMLANGTVDAIVADLTITKDRMGRVRFTVPYLASRLAMVTPFRYGSAGAFWDFLKPFSKELWIFLLGSFVATGAALYLLENKNPDFSVTAPQGKKHRSSSDAPSTDSTSHGGASSHSVPMPVDLATLAPMPAHASAPRPSREDTHNPPSYLQANFALALPASAQLPPMDCTHNPPSDPSSLQRPGPPIYDQASHRRRIMNAYWFTSLCVFTAQQESVRTHLGRFVTVMWLFVMLIFNSSYTASLASMLSAQKRYPTIQGFQALVKNENISVGCQVGSFVESYLRNIDIGAQRLKSFTSEREYAQALREGNMKPDGVGAIIDELPYIKILLESECDFTTSSDDDHLPSFGGFGFAFRKNSPHIDEVSKMILAMAEDGTLEGLQNGWRIDGDHANGDRCSSSEEPSHLRLRNFGGLFSILGSVYAICIMWRLSTKAIQSDEGMCSPLVNPLACAQGGSSFCQGSELRSLSRRSNKVIDESLEHDPSPSS